MDDIEICRAVEMTKAAIYDSICADREQIQAIKDRITDKRELIKALDEIKPELRDTSWEKQAARKANEESGNSPRSSENTDTFAAAVSSIVERLEMRM